MFTSEPDRGSENSAGDGHAREDFMNTWSKSVKREQSERKIVERLKVEESREEERARQRDEHLAGSPDWRPDVDEARGKAIRVLKEEGKLVLCQKCKHMNSHRGWSRVNSCWNCKERITGSDPANTSKEEAEFKIKQVINHARANPLGMAGKQKVSVR